MNQPSAFSLVMKTIPFIFLRFVLYSVFAFLTLLYFGLVYLLGQAVVSIHENVRIAVWILGIIISFPLNRLVKEYLLYMVKAAHVAVLAELATKGELPSGKSQISWGREQVQKRFGQASVLFLMDRLVNGVIGSINGMMRKMGFFLGGIPGFSGLIKLANTILYFSLTYVDESILARNFLHQNESMWKSAETGLVLYAQAWKEILKTAFIVGLVSILIFPILFVVLLVPALAIGHAFPFFQVGAILAALLFSFVLKTAFLDPWTLSSMILTYLKATEGLTPNPSLTQKLEMVSSKFKKLTAKAAETPQTV